MTKRLKLTAAQSRVLCTLAAGWSVRSLYGLAWGVEMPDLWKKRLCNMDTIAVLERQGLVRRTGRIPSQKWTAELTEAGRAWVDSTPESERYEFIPPS